MHRDRTKLVEIDRHFIKENVEGWVIKLLHVSSQAADILTKALPEKNFEGLNFELQARLNQHLQPSLGEGV